MVTPSDDALDELHALFESDGVRFEVVESDLRARRMRLRLDLAGVDCEDCVLPVEILTDVVTDAVRRSLDDDAVVVTLDDPRASGTPLATEGEGR